MEVSQNEGLSRAPGVCKDYTGSTGSAGNSIGIPLEDLQKKLSHIMPGLKDQVGVWSLGSWM